MLVDAKSERNSALPDASLTPVVTLHFAWQPGGAAPFPFALLYSTPIVANGKEHFVRTSTIYYCSTSHVLCVLHCATTVQHVATAERFCASAFVLEAALDRFCVFETRVASLYGTAEGENLAALSLRLLRLLAKKKTPGWIC